MKDKILSEGWEAVILTGSGEKYVKCNQLNSKRQAIEERIKNQRFLTKKNQNGKIKRGNRIKGIPMLTNATTQKLSQNKNLKIK
ncbi:hypothetical protein [Microcoleus sp. FACHB-68]|uniref:hypothetical protein n=1 Tax=Microcoleus sp. FACHB-68 TaxID=2692826 RepID=UPI001F554E0C|nr:hypothetical protein [Microcoleus sp. FACHB-68]